jgi:hypothetical protein
MGNFLSGLRHVSFSGMTLLHGVSYYCCILHIKQRDFFDNLGIDGRHVLKWILKEWDGRVWTEFILLTAETSGGLLSMLMNLLVP